MWQLVQTCAKYPTNEMSVNAKGNQLADLGRAKRRLE
jgi:hypothetical protein